MKGLSVSQVIHQDARISISEVHARGRPELVLTRNIPNFYIDILSGLIQVDLSAILGRSNRRALNSTRVLYKPPDEGALAHIGISEEDDLP